MKDRRPTSFDIAYRAGVSQSTVSRALRNSPQVSQATREKIQAIARELNYRVDKNATALRSQATNTLALLLFEDDTTDDSHINPFFMSLLGNITRIVGDRGYDLLVSFQRLDQDWHLEYELSSKADGLILLGYGDYTDYRSRLEKLAEAGAHLTLWGPSLPDMPVRTVGSDNKLGGQLITQHLLDLGHTRFVFIGNTDAGSPEFAERYEGYISALTQAGIDQNHQHAIGCSNIEAQAVDAAKRCLTDAPEATAIVCASDLIALTVARQLKAAGKCIPQDVSITGFDDMAQASWFDPPLTTVRQDTLRASELLVDNLLAMLNGEDSDNAKVEPRLIARSSTAAPKQ